MYDREKKKDGAWVGMKQKKETNKKKQRAKFKKEEVTVRWTEAVQPVLSMTKPNS